jgi:hypothetical protein
MHFSRRDFILNSATAAGGLLIGGTSFGEPGNAAADAAANFAPPATFKYFGKYSELPFGAVKPRAAFRGPSAKPARLQDEVEMSYCS